MARLPGYDEQEWVIESLAQLVRRRGTDRFVDAPIVEPNDRFFPDRWTPDENGVHRLVRRILHHAGLAELKPDVRFYRDGTLLSDVDLSRDVPRAHHPGAAAWFTGISDGFVQISIELTYVQDVEALVGTLCHEVAHAYREWYGLESDDRDEEERLTDLTALFLGFGVLVTNLAFRYRTRQHDLRAWSYGHDRYGYLDLETFAFALAVQCVARELSNKECRRLAKLLETAQRATFEKALEKLAPVVVQTRELLGMCVSESPRPRGTVLELEFEESAAPPRQPESDSSDAPHWNAGRPVFRVLGKSFLGKRINNFVIGASLGAALALIPYGYFGFVAVVPVGALAMGYWLQRRIPARDIDRCSDSDCAAELRADARTCEGCGGTLVGAIDDPNLRLEAEEALEAESDDVVVR